MISKEQIQELLNKYDLQGLLNLGAPQDEYDLEADLIWDAIAELSPKTTNVANLTEIIYDVFRDCFDDLAGTADLYNDIAEEIHEVWDQESNS